MIEMQTIPLISHEQNIAVKKVALNEWIPALEEQFQLLAMMQHQGQNAMPMERRNLCNIREENVLLSNETRRQRWTASKDATITLNAIDQILDILLLCADQFVEHIATALLGYIAAGQSWIAATAHAAVPITINHKTGSDST